VVVVTTGSHSHATVGGRHQGLDDRQANLRSAKLIGAPFDFVTFGRR
jgi:hypothetical protein